MKLHVRVADDEVVSRGSVLGLPVEPGVALEEAPDALAAAFDVPGRKRVVRDAAGRPVDIAVEPPPPEPPPDPQIAQDRADLPDLLAALADDRARLVDTSLTFTILSLRPILARCITLLFLLVRHLRRNAGL